MAEPDPPTDRMLQIGQMVYEEFRRADVALEPNAEQPLQDWSYLPDKARAKWAMAGLIAVNVGKHLALAKARQIMEDADRVFIRDEVDGKRGTFALTELPAEQAIRHLLRFVETGHGPVTIVEQEDGA